MTRQTDDLRSLLEDRARDIFPETSRRSPIVARVRRRRVARGTLATVLAVGMVTGSVSMALSIGRGDQRGTDIAERPGLVQPGSGPDLEFVCRPQAGTSDGPSSRYALKPSPGEYPVIAEGNFEGAGWKLSVVEDPDAAHPEDTASENPEILFEIEGGTLSGGSFETYRSDEIVDDPLHSRLDDGTEFIMGLVDRKVETLAVDHKDGRSFEVHIFRVSDDTLFPSSYYLALLPTDASGQLVARNDGGEVMAKKKIEKWIAPPCPTISPSDK